jgi:hypothetical protein
VLVEQAVIERIVDDLLAGDTLEHVLTIAERREVAIRVTDRALDDGAADRLVEHLLEHPELERILDGALASRFAHSAATRLGESEDVLRVVDAIARSESVRDALQAQSTGLATELADEVRGRTSRVDDMLERRARALLRRPPRPAPRVDLPTNGP